MAITVPAPGQMIDANTFGKPVADQLNAMAATAWATLPLNGWTAISGRTPMYRKIGDVVYFKGNAVGAAGTGAGSNGISGATIPAGFRPIVYEELVTFCYNGGWTYCNISIDTDGTLKYITPPGAASVTPNNISLVQIYYSLS